MPLENKKRSKNNNVQKYVFYEIIKKRKQSFLHLRSNRSATVHALRQRNSFEKMTHKTQTNWRKEVDRQTQEEMVVQTTKDLIHSNRFSCLSFSFTYSLLLAAGQGRRHKGWLGGRSPQKLWGGGRPMHPSPIFGVVLLETCESTNRKNGFF